MPCADYMGVIRRVNGSWVDVATSANGKAVGRDGQVTEVQTSA